MDAKALLKIVKGLNPDVPLHKQLERDLKIGPGYGRAWYRSQKEHWVRWLSEYDTPGPYGRRPRARTPAETVYNRLMCPPMVFWLAEAVGVQETPLQEARFAAISTTKHQASQAGVIRSRLPWGLVFRCILDGNFEMSDATTVFERQKPAASTSPTACTILKEELTLT
ncbi:hypothetical protein [uncultured Roseovarius sp.]|uniref:hypothetical protein n=1 Tax=uncultured Roseovarius sp. TaxID=293344 RepID=UPI00260CDF36|nr:hypothetical protein [uncultured Roseovarius sp.]